MQGRLNTFLDLSGRSPLVRGLMREVYEHPDYENVLVKVIRPDRATPSGDVIPWRSKRFNNSRTFGIYVSYFREMKEQLRAARNLHSRLDLALPFARLHGIVPTSLGLGLVVEKLTAPDGSLAPTIARLVKEGRFGPEHLDALEAFFRLSAEHHIVFGDLHAGNLAWADGEEGGRFVCVDGVGEKTLIHVHEWSRLANAMKLRRARKRLLAFIDRRSRSARVFGTEAGRDQQRSKPDTMINCL